MKPVEVMGRTRVSVLWLFAVLAVIIAVGCVRKAEQSVNIGVILPMTGPGAAYGRQVWEGIQLCREQINRTGGVGGKTVKLLLEDDQTEPRVGVSTARRLIDIHNVRVIIGALASNVTLAVAPVAERAHVVLMCPGSSSDKISQAGDFVFRIAPTDSYDGVFLAEVASDRLRLRRVAVLYLNNEFGAGLQATFASHFLERGGDIVFSEGFLQGATDFRSQLGKVNVAAADGLFLIANTAENVVVLRQMRELGLRCKVFAPSTFNDPNILKLVPEAAEGVIFSAAGFAGIAKEKEVQDFLGLFKKRYGREPTSFAAYGYDALKVLAAVLSKDGDDSTRIKEALYQVRDFPGASGRMTFDKNGDAQRQLSVFVVRDGRFVPISLGAVEAGHGNSKHADGIM